MVAGCGSPRPGPREAASLACGAGLTSASRTTPRGTEVWCEDDRGAREGRFERRLPDGRVLERASYAAGVLDGDFASFYAGGGPHMQGRYARGRREGAWRAWHENGKPWLEVAFAAGEPTGTWLEYDYTGSKMFEGTYRDGRLEGAWRSFRDGEVSGTGTAVAGRLEGAMTARGGDGETLELRYRNNRRHGTMIVRDKDGKVVYRKEFVDGVGQGSDAP